MPDQTTILSLPHILPSQAQKHVTHNEALRLLDVTVQLTVLQRTLASPPVSPVLGDRYIVAAAPSGAWTGYPQNIALWNGTAWEIFAALQGWRAYVVAEAAMVVFDGAGWSTVVGGVAQFTQVGVGMASSGTNKLAVESGAALFTNPAGSHQLAINKGSAAATGSVLYQQGYLTRAEVGLVGDNNLTVKVSADGTSFATALTVDKDNGRASMVQPMRLVPMVGDAASVADGFLWYNSTTGKFRARQGGATVDLITAVGGGSVFSDAALVLQDNLDLTKQAAFQLSGLTTGTTRIYDLPNASGVVALLSGTQTFSGTTVFSAPVTHSGTTDFSGTVTVSAPVVTLGSSALASTVNLGNGATTTGVTKMVNLATGGQSGSTTTVNIGSNVVGVLGGIGMHQPTTFASSSFYNGAATFNAAVTLAGTTTVSAPMASVGTSAAASTLGIGTGATTSGVTKAVNIGTAGLAGSTTTITLGSAIGGALGQTVVNSASLAVNATSVTMPAANATVAQLGVGGATADATNRLSVDAPGVLFNHAGSSIEATLNKASAPDNARITFKTGFSTRAQFGLSGSDDFALRVSADGAAFNDGFSVAAASGSVSLAKPVILGGQASDPVTPVDGTLWYNSTSGQLKGRITGETRNLDGQREVPFLIPVSGEFILTTMGASGAMAALAGAANRVDLYPFTARADIVVTGIAINCTVLLAAALGKMVIYSSDVDGRPNALLTETATVDLSAVGVKTATAALTLRQGVTYWLGLRSSSTASTSTWSVNSTPDINGGAPVLTSRKVLRRTLNFATAASATWGFLSSEITTVAAPAIWLRV